MSARLESQFRIAVGGSLVFVKPNFQHYQRHIRLARSLTRDL
jgi:hypothetical protein